MGILILELYFFGNILIGFPMAVISILIWENGRKEKNDFCSEGGFWGFVLFPLAAFSGRVGHNPSLLIYLCLRYDGDKNTPLSERNLILDSAYYYMFFTLFLWPLRLLTNCILFIMAAITEISFKPL